MMRLTTDEVRYKQRAQEKILSKIGALFDDRLEVGLDADADFSSREERTLEWTNKIGRHLAAHLQAMSAWALERRNDLRVVVVQDGAPQMWNIMRAAFERFNIPIGFEILDWYHASERIAACLLLVQTGDRRRLALREKWNERFFNDDNAAARFIASLKRRTAALSKAARSELETQINYFAERKHLMNYAKLRKQNIPIGSGATEGACKSLIAARAKRSGQRWPRQGLNAVLNLRAVHQSQRFDPFWKLFANEYKAHKIRPS